MQIIIYNITKQNNIGTAVTKSKKPGINFLTNKAASKHVVYEKNSGKVITIREITMTMIGLTLVKILYMG